MLIPWGVGTPRDCSPVCWVTREGVWWRVWGKGLRLLLLETTSSHFTSLSVGTANSVVVPKPTSAPPSGTVYTGNSTVIPLLLINDATAEQILLAAIPWLRLMS